jgi:hypothetical protein
MFGRSILFCTAALTLAAGNLTAQALGNVVGTVTDPGGAFVPGATVTITNEGTKFSRNAITNDGGQFVADSFPTGKIAVTVEHAGFQKLVRSGLELTAADTITVNVQLSVGNVQQSVEVKAEASLVQSQTATVSSLISSTQTLEMPLNERSFTNLLQLTPGASPSTPGMAAALTGYTMRANNAISLNGATANNNAYLIDGLYDRQLWVSTLVMNPPVEDIQETRILASDYSAQYGNSAGGVTIVLTKSGTNELHGSAFEFLRNSVLDANTFFSNQAGKAKAPYRRNEYGGAISGPIRKDKTFIFADYQGTRIVQPTTTVDTIPTLARQQMVETGNFSQFGTTIYNPYNTTNSSGTTQRIPFAGNIIPQQYLDPAAGKIIALLPVPTSSAATNNFVFNPPGSQRDDEFDIRVDENVGKADRLFFKYSYDNALGYAAGVLPVGPNTNGANVGQYLQTGASGGPSSTAPWSVTANFTKVIGSAMVNEFHFGILRDWLEIYNSDSTHATAASLGIPNINISNDNLGLPYLPISGYTAIGDSNSYPEFTHSVSIPFEDILSVVKGSHTLKFGGGYTRHRFDGHTSTAPRGQYNFGGQFTRQIGSSSAATALADFALGASTVILRSEQFGTFGLRIWEGSTFAEDSWRVNNRLTVTYGLRWELQAPPYEVHNRWANISVATGQFAVAGTPTQNLNGDCGRSLVCLDRKDFAPRLGIAQQLTKDGKTVFRAGFGMSYFEGFNGGRMLISNPPMNVIQTFTTDQNAAPGILLSQGLPLPVLPNLSNPTQLTGLYYNYASHMKLNKSLQFSTGIQRELIANTLLDVSYVRTLTEDMTNSVVGNQALPGPGPLAPRRPLYSINPVLGDIDLRTNWGMAKYNALQVKATKRYSRGLTGALAWTWSHNMGQTNGPGSSTRPQNSLCYVCEWGDLPEDRRHMVVINHVYELPFGPGRQYLNQGVLSHIVGDWQVTGIWTMYTGMHFGPSEATSVSNTLTGAGVNVSPTERPNLNGTPNLPSGQRTITHWFNTAAFSIPAQYTWGTAGPGILVGPGYFTLDLGIHRTFPIKERYRLTFRAEMFNTLNHANFNNPNATIGSTSAGIISATYPARIMQGALKFTF